MWIVGATVFSWISLFIIIASKFTTPDKIYPYNAIMIRILLKLLFIKVEVINKEVVDTSKAYIFIPNHNSLIDVLLAGAFIPVYVNALEAESHFNWFFYGGMSADELMKVTRGKVYDLVDDYKKEKVFI